MIRWSSLWQDAVGDPPHHHLVRARIQELDVLDDQGFLTS